VSAGKRVAVVGPLLDATTTGVGTMLGLPEAGLVARHVVGTFGPLLGAVVIFVYEIVLVVLYVVVARRVLGAGSQVPSRMLLVGGLVPLIAGLNNLVVIVLHVV